ncbi:Cof-type HAD-IIB family hydrolase [Moraxella pluranimalium]|uniref:Hydrolase n=1 Tax=Moraxella pluranimalium TaxID=470453 RepID=A0A1T0CPD8_9GAMM|nr:Cof-type HAD-IIB family hydrolase [Moraxella pluranimalium]OOS24119.1 hypothetical protein B0680_04850 [Moraxella pluranimalium]
MNQATQLPHTPRPKIVFFDIDDTLYIKDTNHVPSSVAPALKALKATGTLIAIASGRSLGVIPPVVQALIADVGIELLLTINGGYNLWQGKPFLDFPLATDKVRTIIQTLDADGIGHACMTHDTIYAMRDTPNLRTALASLHIPYQFVSHDDFDDTQAVYQILAFYADGEYTPALPPQTKTVRWHQVAVDVLDSEGSKARAIAQVLDKLGIDTKDACAFGDGLNDVEMHKLVGTAIAMGNAHDELKRHADIVCLRHDEDGIAKILGKLGWIDAIL